jgi:hypothetical protein
MRCAAQRHIQQAARILFVRKRLRIAGHQDDAFALKAFRLGNGADGSCRWARPGVVATVGDLRETDTGALVVPQRTASQNSFWWLISIEPKAASCSFISRNRRSIFDTPR